MGAEQSAAAAGGVTGVGAVVDTKNVDKRTSRRQHRTEFVAAIDHFRKNAVSKPVLKEINNSGVDGVHRAKQARPQAGMRVMARKRPIFEHELGRAEFDAVTCKNATQVVVHDAKMRPDMRQMYMDHHEFKFDQIFDERVDNDSVYLSAAAPLVHLAASGGYATAMMFGQTGR